MLYENGEFERIRPHLTPLECGIIFDGIPEGAISRKVGLIWGIPVENVRPGGYVPEERIKDMDADGVDVIIIYPSAGLLLYSLPDSALVTALFKTYNDWLAEFCRLYPNRLQGIAMLNLDHVPEGVKELERCAKTGLAGAMITVYPPEGRAYDSAEYELL